ncbi:phosphatidylinositol 3-kinase 1-like [Battus philenor]|uniref:phosphatidylinositol 3-kinase 1-like n=1 Tax=Battus philenor TaxID=42288 RepID=UPI0035CFD314
MKTRCGFCVVLVQFYVFSLASKPRSVNLALETTFEFNNKHDVAIIEKVRKFLDKIENAVDEKLSIRTGKDNVSEYEFTDFLRELLTTINSFNDKNLKAVLRIFNEEIRSHNYRGYRFKEIMEDGKLRRYILLTLKKIKDTPIHLLRKQLKMNLKGLKKKYINKQNTSFLNFLNVLYKRQSPAALKKTIENFKLYKNTKKDTDANLRDIIRNAIKTIIYDRYSNLEDNVRRDVKSWLELMIRIDSNFNKNNSHISDIKTSKIYHKTGKTSTQRRYTFVTLYPEAIDFSKNNFNVSTTESIWSERTIPNKNYFYLVKGAQARVNDREDRQVKKSNISSASLEEDWRTHRRRVTSALWLVRQNIAGFNKNFEKTNKNDKWLRRADQNENGNNKNETASASYLERIKQLENELKKMKKELSAKISSITYQFTTEPNKEVEDYSDYVDQEEFLGESKSKNKVDNKPITIATTESDTFTTKIQIDNKTVQANYTRIEQPKQLASVFEKHNITFRAIDESIETSDSNHTNTTTVSVKPTSKLENITAVTQEMTTISIINNTVEATEVFYSSNITENTSSRIDSNSTPADKTTNTTILEY